MTPKAVIDTSCLLSAALRPRSIPDRAVKLAISTCQVYTCTEHIAEVEAVFRRPRFNCYIDLESRLSLLQNFRTNALFCIVTKSTLIELRGCCRDESDEFLLALALTAHANVIVSSDHDLLVLHPWRGIPILTPAQFLAQFTISR